MRYSLMVCLLGLTLCFNVFATAQEKHTFTLTGDIVDEQARPIARVNISVLDKQSTSTDNGAFNIEVRQADS